MLSTIHSLGLYGLDAFPVLVEADLSVGMPSFNVVGLPDATVKESRDRVRSAIKNSGFDFPISRIVINLAPADKRKEGSVYDLPILIALLCASGQLPADCASCGFLGELSLSGEIKPMRGVLPMAIEAKRCGLRELFVPMENAQEGAVVEGLTVYPVHTIDGLIRHLLAKELLTAAKPNDNVPLAPAAHLDFADVRGQAEAKRAMEIAAAGGHNVLLIGPPGSGKSMLAKRLPSILPEMSFEESIETTKLHSIAGCIPTGASLIRIRPFRSPHHTVSAAGLSGGGTIPRPGEISLAHNGVLFLDELPEFSRSALEVLRQPVEDGMVSISRVSGTVSYPCSITLVAAMNPCPCGFYGHPTHRCTCSAQAVKRYLSRISGPLLDRLDLHVEVPPVEFDELDSEQKAESSAVIQARVNEARDRQRQRFSGTSISCNAQITPDQLQEVCMLKEEARKLLKSVFERLGLSARSYDRILKVSRTIADLDGCEKIEARHAAEAVQYRNLDRKYWCREDPSALRE